jgi:hypothetical protein
VTPEDQSANKKSFSVSVAADRLNAVADKKGGWRDGGSTDLWISIEEK